MIFKNKYLNKKEKGFTLVEIAIAILILATSLTVMLGLEQSSIQQTLNDQNKRIALSYARKIMSYIDIPGGDASNGEKKIDINVEEERESSLLEFLKENEINYDIDDEGDDIKDRLENFHVILKTSYPELAGIDKSEIIILVELTIFWGESKKEQVKLVRLVEPDNEDN